ncbi:MAG: hypothetical protein ACO3OC_11620 [Ilumatobacteraceae bacterium]
MIDDGLTWSTVEGSSICIITREEFEKLLEGEIDPSQLRPVSEITLRQTVQGGPYAPRNCTHCDGDGRVPDPMADDANPDATTWCPRCRGEGVL